MDLEFPEDLKYTRDHEWVRRDSDGMATVGITAFAVDQLGDVTYVEFPKLPLSVKKGDSVATVDSVKAASEVYAPVAGTLSEVNSRLDNEPELVNASPYGDGWFVKLTPADAAEFESLLSADEYRRFVEEQAE